MSPADLRSEPAGSAYSGDTRSPTVGTRGEQLPNGLGSERELVVGACVGPAFNVTSGITARFAQTANVRIEASTPPYVVVTEVYGRPRMSLKRRRVGPWRSPGSTT